MPAPKRDDDDGEFDKVRKWLEDNLPACRCIDMMVANHKYGMPEKTKQFFDSEWIKLSDQHGGTYAESAYYEANKATLDAYYK